MEVKVIREFVDKHTGKYYRKESMYTSESLARIKELQEAGFVERAPLPAKKTPEVVETAVAEAPENALRPKSKRKKRDV